MPSLEKPNVRYEVEKVLDRYNVPHTPTMTGPSRAFHEMIQDILDLEEQRRRRGG